ncbi:MAG: GNAT family N-acetyltransferase, partial [Streptosporangiaceae bacterium]
MARRFDNICTDRLVMRRWRDADREAYAALNADPDVMRYFPAPLSRATSNASVDRIEDLFDAHGFGLWALEVAATSEFIGFAGLNPMPDGVPGAGGMEVGWRLARQAWHKGFATEAARAAVDVAFTGAGLAELWSMTAVLNRPSQAVMLRIGMTPHA